MADACADFLQYDLTQWPLVVATSKAEGSLSGDISAKFDAHLHCFLTLLNHNVPFSIIFDVRIANGFGMTYLRPTAEFLNVMKPKLEENLCCSCIITDSMLVRGLLNALFLVHRPVKPCLVAGNPAEATAFVEGRMNSAPDTPTDNYVSFSGDLTPADTDQLAEGAKMARGVGL